MSKIWVLTKMGKYKNIGKGLLIVCAFSASVVSNAYYENKFYQIRGIDKHVMCEVADSVARSTLYLCDTSSIMYWEKCKDAVKKAKYALTICSNKTKYKKALNDKIIEVSNDYQEHKNDLDDAKQCNSEAECDEAEANANANANASWTTITE